MTLLHRSLKHIHTHLPTRTHTHIPTYTYTHTGTHTHTPTHTFNTHTHTRDITGTISASLRGVIFVFYECIITRDLLCDNIIVNH